MERRLGSEKIDRKGSLRNLGSLLESLFSNSESTQAQLVRPTIQEFVRLMWTQWKTGMTSSILFLIAGACFSDYVRVLLLTIGISIGLATCYKIWKKERERVIELDPAAIIEDEPSFHGEIVGLILGLTSEEKWRGYIHFTIVNDGHPSFIKGFNAGFKLHSEGGYLETNFSPESEAGGASLWIKQLSSQAPNNITFVDGENPTKTISKGDCLDAWIVLDRKPLQSGMFKVTHDDKGRCKIESGNVSVQIFFSDYKNRRWSTTCKIPEVSVRDVDSLGFKGGWFAIDKSKSKTIGFKASGFLDRLA